MILSSSPAGKACCALTALLVFNSSLMAAAAGGPTVTVKEPVAVTVTSPVAVTAASPLAVTVAQPVSVTAASPLAVTVAQPVAVTLAQPVYVEVLNDALKTVYNKRFSGQIPANSVNTIISLPNIPAGKRLVIEAIGVRVLAAVNTKATAAFTTGGTIAQDQSINGIFLPLPLPSQGAFGAPERETCVGLHSVRIVIDPSLTPSPQINVFRSGTSVADILCTVAGYLEDLPTP